MPLKIVLKPGEKVVVNQAVMLNGGDKAELVLENKARVLRERDIMTEDGADTPAKRVYFIVQMLYLFPDKARKYQEKFNTLVREFVNAAPSSTPLVFDIGKRMVVGDAYGALKLCRKLISYEEEVLKHAACQH
jgi:flagellar protein FlbT